MEPTQTAFIVPVPEAEEAVGRFRASLDKAASWGVPAHGTVLYPLLPPERINDEVLVALGEIVGAVPRVDVTLTHIEWFGDSAAWLAPQPVKARTEQDQPIRSAGDPADPPARAGGGVAVRRRRYGPRHATHPTAGRLPPLTLRRPLRRILR